MTTKEEIAIKELRAKITDIIRENGMFDDDLYLLQWLKVQKMNVSKTENMIRGSVKWRKENKCESLVNEPFTSDEKKYLVCYLDENTVTKEGIPVFLTHMGKADILGHLEKHGRERHIRSCIKINLKVEQLVIAYNKKMKDQKLSQTDGHITYDSATGLHAISNVKDYSLAQSKSLSVMQAQIEAMNIMNNYFPVIFSHGYFINVNKFFSTMLKIIKPLLQSHTLTLEVFGADEEEKWQTICNERMNAETIRADFGGTLPI